MARNIYEKYVLSIQVRKNFIPFKALAGYLSVSSRVFLYSTFFFISTVVGQQETVMGHRENERTWGWA